MMSNVYNFLTFAYNFQNIYYSKAVIFENDLVLKEVCSKILRMYVCILPTFEKSVVLK